MKFPIGFVYDKCIPTEEDFKIAFEAKKTGDYFKLTKAIDSSDEEYRYVEIRRFIAIVLMD